MKKFYTLAMGICSLALANAQVSKLGPYVQVNDVSNTGVAVGNLAGVAFFMWTEENEGTIIGEAGEYGVSVNCNITADGSVISLALPNPANEDKEEAVLYTVADESLNFLGHLGASSGADTSSAWGMSSNGENVVGFAWNSSARGEAVIWKNGGPIVGLGSTVATRSSRADAVSADGSVVVGWQDSDIGFRQGAVWRNGVQELLKDDEGNILGEASAVSADGKTICGSDYSGRGYIWNETEGTIYLSSDNPDFMTIMSVLSDDGKTALGLSFDPMDGGILLGEGFIWTKEGGKVNLNDYVDSLGFDDLDIVFSVPTGISPDGKYIGGIGPNFVENEAQGFLIKLPGANMASNEVAKSAPMSVYPNPVKDIITIKTADQVESAGVYSATGQLVFSAKNIVNKQIDLSSLAKGVYVLQVKTDKGVQSTKLIKD